MSIEAYRERPIVQQANPPTARDYKQVPVDLSGSFAKEKLVDLADFGVRSNCYYARRDGLNAPYCRPFASCTSNVLVRESVAERLAAVNRALASAGIELYVLDGYRPLSVQSELWAFFIEQAQASLDDPSEHECEQFAGRYCSDPRKYDLNDSRTWPTHITGGAVDTTLRSLESGDLLFMGGIFDDPAEVSHTPHYERLLASADGDLDRLNQSELEALRNRRILFWAMDEAGLASYAFEWWHFDFGTQLWVMNSINWPGEGRAAHACYGPYVE